VVACPATRGKRDSAKRESRLGSSGPGVQLHVTYTTSLSGNNDADDDDDDDDEDHDDAGGGRQWRPSPAGIEVSSHARGGAA
jgi:hypothetical protein